jgi:hypothetical protein
MDDSVRQRSQRIADLQNQAAELERQLMDARLSVERALGEAGSGTAGDPPAAGAGAETGFLDYGTPDGAADAAGVDDGLDDPPSPDEARTEVLVTRGRSGGSSRRLSHRQLIIVVAAATALAITILVLAVSGGGASWPASVATVQAQSVQACKNPDVASEPGQVNFACAPQTRQVLWIFALMTSGDNPSFADARTGRMGLEPITPAQGGDVAWSLNLHHPYNPTNAVDSLAVAARAINNIIGGATVTGADGSPVIQAGLEGSPANCTRYTGSAAMRARRGFPRVCARPVTSPAGEAALVQDVYQKWIVGAAPQFAQDAAILFENASNPGSPQVQVILQQLRQGSPLG